MTGKRWEVLTSTLCQGYVNCWHEGDEPMTFATEAEAEAEIAEYIGDCEYEVSIGERDADYVPDREDFIVCEVGT